MDTRMWADMFQLGVPLAEKVFRSAVIYAFLVVGLRVTGKRQLAQLNPFDLIVLLTLSNTVQNAIIGNDNSLVGGAIGAAVLLFVNHWVVRLRYRHAWLDRFLEGEPTVLIENGKMREEDLERELVTPEELTIAAHKQGFDSIAEIERGELEPEGGISFTRRLPHQDDVRHQELLAAFAELKKDLSALAARRGPDPQAV